MRRLTSRKVIAGAVGVTLAAAGAALAPLAFAQENPPAAAGATPVHQDDMFGPMEADRRQAREEAIQGVLAGKYTAEQNGASTVVNMGSDGKQNLPGHNKHTQYVELAREATDQIFVITVEFGDDLGGVTPDPTAQRTEGPLHNQIPEPDRSVDNATVWQADFSREHYQDLYFGAGESLKNYYEAQSSGRYSVNGEVQDWVDVPYTEAYYGSNTAPGGDARAWLLIRDAADAWYQSQLNAGKTAAEIADYLAQFDVYDRYDFDGDGDFNEPDGYIDHFQIVHAGGDEADGDPIYAGDALWSHRWQAFQDLGDGAGPWNDSNSIYGSIGGAQVGTSPIWIFDYTLQPENGGRSVFYHEYGHDLGLPDDYNINGGGDNSLEHWTLMAQSRLGSATDEGIGERGGDLSAWNKLQLGWLDYEFLPYTAHKTLKLGPVEYQSEYKQALIVGLPPKQVSTDVGAPYAGAGQYLSGHVDDTAIKLAKTVTVPADGHLTFKTRFDIEYGWDAAWVAVNGTPVVGTVAGIPTLLDGNNYGDPGNVTPEHPSGNYYGYTVGWDWVSVTPSNTYGWVDGDFDLSTYAGQTVELSFVYKTDAAAGGNYSNLPDGLFLDDITLGGTVIGDGESGLGDWTSSPAGQWKVAGSQSTALYNHYYIASYRSYTAYDKYLQTGPYFFGYTNTMPDYVDHYAYQQGMLVAYWDLSQGDNDTVGHPGSGRNLNIDAHPAPMAQAGGPGGYWRARVQIYDAPFGTRTTDTVTLHVNGEPFTFGGLPGNPTFDDTAQYWYPEVPNQGVKLPGYGVKIRVLNDSAGRLQVKLN